MAPARKAPAAKKQQRHGALSREMAVMAWHAGHAMAQGWPVAATLRTRPPRKVRGMIVKRSIDKRRRMTGRDGESNLVLTIEGENGREDVPLESIAELARSRRSAAAAS